MASELNDPMGQAILDFSKTKKNKDIIVSSELCDDDVIPSAYLHRSYSEMPILEKTALNNCIGRILDVGAGAGVHASYLQEKGHTVHCIDISPLSIHYLIDNQFSAEQIDFFQLPDEKYDTVLMLMNGIGIAGTLSNLERTLLKARTLLKLGGKIICDSSDIKYLYEDDEGGTWIDLNAEYYGNFKYKMSYEGHTSDWFDWLYVDYESMKTTAEKVGFEVNLLHQENDEYLVELINKHE
ncbi:MAG: class I SAM-dependent methyltransferase [Crocinitomicaceae bacterium]|nr:class I SAM-dependent methyltransferase [Crocinitomicaceae bacterium]